jgi:hypothetical protein
MGRCEVHIKVWLIKSRREKAWDGLERTWPERKERI